MSPPVPGDGIDDAVMGRVLVGLLEAAHQAAPGEIAGLVADAGRAMGLSVAQVWLADVQERMLVPLPRGAGPAVDAQVPLEVDGSPAGRAYRTQRPHRTGGSASAWVPLVDGIERIGVLRVSAVVLTDDLLERCRALASLVALIVVSKSAYSDLLVRAVRSQPMSLQAELLWAFVPPRTIGTREATSSAILEPAYQVAGDAFDHSLLDDVLHLTLVDAMGHDLASGGAAAIALAASRSTRHRGGTLTDIAAIIDRTLQRWIPDLLLTAFIADLDCITGRLSWINCAHPPPLLIRDRQVLPHALERSPDLPLGISGHGAPQMHRVDLEPGDRILIHTDGVTEARSPAGELFGERRLVDAVVRTVAAGEPAPEALRRLVGGILAHHAQRLRDDATVMLVEWHPHLTQR
ncbi:PP2C family protein-serine/threonine phosphatase [Kitasatospora indigofera]|uniref:PP2C family protein-serine/threonine phosphatase n=1 Tax=Kitasatospora indigofera TaxID=67307 RepID=UPI0036CAE98E